MRMTWPFTMPLRVIAVAFWADHDVLRLRSAILISAFSFSGRLRAQCWCPPRRFDQRRPEANWSTPVMPAANMQRFGLVLTQVVHRASLFDVGLLCL